jgi:hypothetical protein
MRYNQPQSGPFQPDLNGELLAGGKLLALIIGSGYSHNLADGEPLVKNGTLQRTAISQGLSVFNPLGGGDLSANIDAAGGSIVVDFWCGRFDLGSPANPYLFGDYDGTNGTGLAARHPSIGNRWGYFEGALNDSGETLVDGTYYTFVVVRDTIAGTAKIYRDGVYKFTSAGAPVFQGKFAVGSIGQNQYSSFGAETMTVLAGRIRFKAWDARMVASFTRNPWQLFQSPQRRIFSAATGGTDTPVNPSVGALALSGYSPSIAQTANQALTPNSGTLTFTGYAPAITQPQSVTPAQGSLFITGYAPSITQGVTTTIAPGAGTLAITGYAPAIAQSANNLVFPPTGTLTLTGYAPALAQTTNQAITPAQGAIAITGYAPTVAQAAASPSLTPDPGLLQIVGYAPSVTQSAPVTKIGGDDVPRHEDEERIEIWEPRKPQPKRDDSLDKVVREAYAKATGKPIAATIAKPGPSVRAPDPEPFDYEEDDFEVLLLSY